MKRQPLHYSSMNFLDRRVASAGIPSSRNEDWQPLIAYRNSLLHGESDHGATAAVVPIVTSKRAYTRKRNKDYNEDDDDDNDDSDADPDFRG